MQCQKSLSKKIKGTLRQVFFLSEAPSPPMTPYFPLLNTLYTCIQYTYSCKEGQRGRGANHTVQTADLSLPSIRQIPQLHSWIENKFMLRLLLCILGLFLPHNFTLGFHYPGSEGDSDRIQSEDIRILWKNFLSFLVGMKHTHLTLFMHNGLLSQWRKGILNKF